MSEKSLAIPPVVSSYFHPKIFPKEFETTFAKSIIYPIATLSAFMSGLRALIKDDPITAARALIFSFKTRTWFAHVSDVLIKSP